MTQATEVLFPASSDEAVAAFGDGTGVTLIGGGTIVVPEITYGRRAPTTALMLGKAGLAGISREGSRVTIGATTPLAELLELPRRLARAQQAWPTVRVRSQATVGGNLCAGEGAEVPRGDLQSALLAVGAVVSSAGADGVSGGATRGLPPTARLAAAALRLL